MSEARKDFVAPFILAIDVGTSSTRTLLFDAHGAAVPDMIAQRTYKLTISAQGEVSVQADELAAVVAETITEVLRLAGPYAQQIAAVALDTFWHSLLGVDSHGRPLTPVITWEDTRSAQAVNELRAQLDESIVHARTGVHFHASYWPAKLRWLREEQADVCKDVAQWISFGEYLHRLFLGRSICTVSMASATGLLNIQELQWDHELMQVLGVRAEQLPPIGDFSDRLQGLTESYAQRWPSLQRVPWFAAIGDGASACIGSGSTGPDRWSLTMGTSSAMRVVIEPGHIAPPDGLWLYFVDRKRAVLGGALSEGGNLLNWLRDTLTLPELEQAEAQAAAVEPDSHGVTMLPFISGERSLGWHSEARLTITGLSRDTTPAEIVRAGYEALAYRLLALHERLSHAVPGEHRLLASGGVLLNSSTIRQILADTLGTAIYPSREQEASARGVALLALEALGVIKNLDQIALAISEPTRPDKTKQDVYRQGAERQQKLYQILLKE